MGSRKMLTTHEIRCPMIFDGRIPSPVIVYHLTVHNLQQVLYSCFILPKWFAEFPSTISTVASIWTSLNLKTLDFWSEVENICSWAWFWGCNVEQRWLLVQEFQNHLTLIYWFGWIIVVYSIHLYRTCLTISGWIIIINLCLDCRFSK